MSADMQVLVRHIRRMASRGRFAKDSDRLLLESYVRDGNQDAFATIVGRHAGLVAGVCRRVLSNTQDIEDVFQATFLVLARKAGAVRWHDSVANWLHSVAHRLALRARADAARRQTLEDAVCAQATAAGPPEQTREIQIILDAELDSLPEVQRLPLILCYLEGRTRDEAARQCGWSLRTLERRLEKGRSLLRDRLVRRGLDLSVVLLAAALSEQSGTACTHLTSTILKLLSAQKTVSGLTGSSVLRLAETALPLAGVGYLKLAAGLMLALAVTGIGAYACLQGTANEISSSTKSGGQDPLQAEENKAPIQNALLSVTPKPLPQGAIRLGNERFRGTGFGLVQYSSDGQRLITAGRGGVQVFDSASGNKLLHLTSGLNFNGERFSEWSSAISGDGKFAALADATGAHRGVVYDVATGRQICQLQTPANRTTHLACFSRDGSLLAALVSQVCVDLYDTATGKLVRTIEWEEKYLPPANYSIYWGEVGFLADNQSMAVSIHHTGMIRVFDVASGKETRQMNVSPHGMAGMALSPNGTKIVALPCVARQTRVTGFKEEPDESVQVLDAATGKQLGELLIPNVDKHWLKIGPNNKTLFASSGVGLGMWNLVTARHEGTLPFPMSMTFCVSPDSKTIAFPHNSVLEQIDIKTGKEVIAFDGHVGQITALAVSPTGSNIVTGGSDGKIILWDRSTGKRMRQFEGPASSVLQLVFSQDAQVVYVLSQKSGMQPGNDVTLRSFNIVDGKAVPPFNVIVGNLGRRGRGNDRSTYFTGTRTLALNGDQLALLKTESIVLLDASTGKFIREQTLATRPPETHPQAFATALTYSNESKQLLAWTMWQFLWRGDWAMKEMVTQPIDELARADWADSDPGTLPFQQRAPRVAAFSPDGKLLALGGNKPYLQLLSVETGKELRRVARNAEPTEGAATELAFAPDGRSLIWSDSNKGFVHIADVASGQIVRQLPAFGGGATALTFSNDGKWLVVGCADSTAIVWDWAKLPAND